MAISANNNWWHNKPTTVINWFRTEIYEKTMIMNPNSESWIVQIQLEGTNKKMVDIYLGQEIGKDMQTSDVNRRIRNTWSTFGSLNCFTTKVRNLQQILRSKC